MSFLHEMTAECICLDSSVEIISVIIIVVQLKKWGGGAEAPLSTPLHDTCSAASKLTHWAPNLSRKLTLLTLQCI